MVTTFLQRGATLLSKLLPDIFLEKCLEPSLFEPRINTHLMQTLVQKEDTTFFENDKMFLITSKHSTSSPKQKVQSDKQKSHEK